MTHNTKGKLAGTKSSNPAREKMGLRSAVLMGLGGMISAGIFVVLGEAGAVAGSAV
jgi:amino acid transporter